MLIIGLNKINESLSDSYDNNLQADFLILFVIDKDMLIKHQKITLNGGQAISVVVAVLYVTKNTVKSEKRFL